MLTPEARSIVDVLQSKHIARSRHREEKSGSYSLFLGVRPLRPSDALALLQKCLPDRSPRELRFLMKEAAWSGELPIVGHTPLTDDEADGRPFQTFHAAVLPRWLPLLDYERPSIRALRAVDVRQWTDTSRPDLVTEAETYARQLRRALALTAPMLARTAAKALGVYDDLYHHGHGPGLEWVDHVCAARTMDGAICIITQPYMREIERRHFDGMLRAQRLYAAGSLYAPYYPRNASVVVLSNGPLRTAPALATERAATSGHGLRQVIDTAQT